MTAQLKLEFFAGEDIHTACSEAARLATMLGVVACFDFNGVHVMAHAGDDPEALAEAWGEALASTRSYKIASVRRATPQTPAGADHA